MGGSQSGVVHQQGNCKGNCKERAIVLTCIWGLQVWLQEFAWREKDKPGRMQQRNQSMAPEDREIIQQEPMFCFEHCWLCLYWSWLCYDFQEVSEPSLQLHMPLDERRKSSAQTLHIKTWLGIAPSLALPPFTSCLSNTVTFPCNLPRDAKQRGPKSQHVFLLSLL